MQGFGHSDHMDKRSRVRPSARRSGVVVAMANRLVAADVTTRIMSMTIAVPIADMIDLNEER
jgi:hypothetical protein